MTKYSTTLSSKNQITLPVELLQALGWSSGQKFSLVIKDNSLVLQTFEDILDDISQIVANYNLPQVSIKEAIDQTRDKNNNKFQYEN